MFVAFVFAHLTDESLGRLDQGAVHAVHLVVEAAGVAEVVAGAVAAPQRRRNGATVDALAALPKRKLHAAVTAHRPV